MMDLIAGYFLIGWICAIAFVELSDGRYAVGMLIIFVWPLILLSICTAWCVRKIQGS